MGCGFNQDYLSGSVFDSTVDLPIVGTVNPLLLFGGLGLLAVVLLSGEGKSYSREKTKKIRSKIHGARMTRTTKQIDAAKRRMRAAQARLQRLEAS